MQNPTEAGATLMKIKSWSRRHVHDKESSRAGAGAVSFLRRLRSPGFTCFCSGSADITTQTQWPSKGGPGCRWPRAALSGGRHIPDQKL